MFVPSKCEKKLVGSSSLSLSSPAPRTLPPIDFVFIALALALADLMLSCFLLLSVYGTMEWVVVGFLPPPRLLGPALG